MKTFPALSSSLWMVWLAANLVGLGCSRQATPPPTAKSEPAVDAVLRAEVVELHPQAWPMTVRVQGGLTADEITVVGAKVAGRVAAVQFDLGDAVPSEAPMVTLDRTEFELQVAQSQALLAQARAAIGLAANDDGVTPVPERSPAVLEAKAVWEEAATRLRRLQRLREQNAVTTEEYETAIAAEKVAESRYASALNGANEKVAIIQVRAAELDLARQQLADAVCFAPFAASIQQRHVAPGTYVQVGNPLMTLVRTDTLRFRGAMPERHAHRLAVGQQVRLFIESIAEPVEATVTRISPTIDPMSRALTFEADVDNRAGRLRSGLFAEAEVIVDPRATALVLNAGAIQEFAGVEKVWKMVNGEAREQVIQTGERRSEAVTIVDGLQSGDIVLTDASIGRVARVEATLVEQAGGNFVSTETPDQASPDAPTTRQIHGG
ncbi:MAG: efflux RND transporter periplasmic adaptor subunit [Planctomycetales bacterium]|nr:efflux RND transporter periplasmic adaptor subunit [Planctomycetales bacterium]